MSGWGWGRGCEEQLSFGLLLRCQSIKALKSLVFSSPGSWGAYSIGRLRRRSSVRPQFQTTSPLKLLGRLQPNFIYSLQAFLGKKSCSNGLGHMNNMATMPIYGKNLKKISSPELVDQ